MNSEIKKIVDRMKTAQAKVQKIVQDQDWVDEARKYAEKQRTEMKKLLSSENVAKLEAFVQKQRKELERFQKQIPGEVAKLKEKLQVQRKEFEKVLNSLGKEAKKRGKKATAKAKRAARPKRGKKTSS